MKAYGDILADNEEFLVALAERFKDDDAFIASV